MMRDIIIISDTISSILALANICREPDMVNASCNTSIDADKKNITKIIELANTRI